MHAKFIKKAINRNNPEPKSRNLTQLSVATGCFSLWLLPYEKQGTNTQITTKSYRKNTYYIITRTVCIFLQNVVNTKTLLFLRLKKLSSGVS
jgi:hypothetical protein